MNDDLVVKLKEHVAPRTPAEEFIAEIYDLNLKGEPLGVYDNLAALNASQAAWVTHCLQQVFHVDISLDCLLLHATIDRLVNLLSELWGGREIVDEIAWTFLQLKKHSDDEVKSQLAEEISINSLGDT